MTQNARRRRSKAQGFSSTQRERRLLAARKADQAELEIWRRVALELSENRQKETVDTGYDVVQSP